MASSNMELVSRRTNLMSPSAAWLQAISPRSPTFASRGGTLRSAANLRGSKSLPWLHSHGVRNRASALLPEHGSVAAAAAASMLQQSSRGLLADYDSRLSQNFWSGQSSPSQRLPPVASRFARRENFKKEHYTTELDRIADGTGYRRGRSKENLEKASLEELEKKVKTGCCADEVGELVQNVAKQNRKWQPQKLEELEQMAKQAERDALAQEAAASKPVVKLRRRRESADRPRDPRWRVEERIKREKEYWRDTGEAPEVTQNLPMTQFSLQSDHGKQEHTLVDIHAIQARCRGLSANCTAKGLLEQQLRREQAEAEKKVSKPDCKAELEALASLTWEDRVEIAQRRKLQGHVSTIFNKMGAMRSKYPKDIPDSLLNPLHAMAQGDYSWRESDY